MREVITYGSKDCKDMQFEIMAQRSLELNAKTYEAYIENYVAYGIFLLATQYIELL